MEGQVFVQLALNGLSSDAENELRGIAANFLHMIHCLAQERFFFLNKL
jgi:hypothetical protein